LILPQVKLPALKGGAYGTLPGQRPLWEERMTMKRVDDKSFGGQMRQLRQAKKVSLESLASITGFSERYLKGIEEGIAVPPVSAVIQIAKALSIDSGSFLSAEDQEDSERKRRESFFKRTQAYSYKTLTPYAETKHMKAFLVTIDPQQDHQMVEYRHEGEEFLYVLKGELEVNVAGNPHLLKKDQTLHFDSGLPHKLHNLSDEEAKLIVVIYTP
jgi:quercetin dioxygenase-like cupin family protein